MTATGALQFDAAAHIYSIDGVPVPSVTDVLADVGIVDYSQIPDGTRVMALERGRYVHLACQFYDEGDLGTLDPALVGYLDAWKRFREECRFEPLLIEDRHYNATYGFAGCLDRTGTMAGKSDVLLDIKTNCAPYWTAFQTAGYASFFDKPARFRRMAVELHNDASYRLHEYRCSNFSADLGVFLAALTVYNAKRRQKP